jgi:DNA-binding NtrC family response regulator
MISESRFRRDLYFRLGVVRVEIPSLNERRDDIVPLAKHFLVAFNTKFEKKLAGLASEAEKALLTHNWTGNVRELKNLMERGVLIAKGTRLTRQDLGLNHKGTVDGPATADWPVAFPPIPKSGIDLNEIERSLERYYLEQAYQMANGNESQAAKLLGINHHTYRYRRKKLR